MSTLTSNWKHFLLAIIFALSLTACGSGTESLQTQTGVFVDSAVVGVSYRTATQSGITDADGHYNFLSGETVIFSIGGIDFPPVQAKGIITPLDIAGSSDPTNPVVLNIARLLQTLDSDSDASNGITIDQSKIPSTASLDFQAAPADFEAKVQADLAVTLISEAQAQAHIETELADQIAAGQAGTGGTGSGGSGTGTGTSFTISAAVSGLTAGQGVTLLNNSDVLAFTTNGTTIFPAQVPSGSSYLVTVRSTTAGVSCNVVSGSGTATANVTVQVNCSTTGTPTIAVTSPLNGALFTAGTGGTFDVPIAVTITNFDLSTGAWKMEIDGNTASAAFFSTSTLKSFAVGSHTIIFKLTGPGKAYTPLASQNTDTVTFEVKAAASSPTYTVSGTITNLTGSTTLSLFNAQGQQKDDAPNTTNGSFSFNAQLADGSTYDVRTSNTDCTVTNGTGTISSANVTNVAIDCTSTNPTPVAGLASSGRVWMKLSLSAPVPTNLTGSIIVGNDLEIRIYNIGVRSLGSVNASTVFSTVDGINWTETSFNTPTFQIKYMAWNGSKYIAIAISADGKNAMVTNSSDGTTWATPVDLGTVVNPLAIGSNGTTTIIAGSNGYIASSTDLTTWTTRVARDKFRQVYHIQGVSWTGTQFVATGTRGHISTSPDGIAWTDRTNAAVAGTGDTLGDAVSVSGKTFIKLRPAGAFVASPKTIISSTDGVTWATSLTPSAASSSNGFHQPGIAKTGDLLISYSETVNFQEIRYLLSSSDGITFTLDDVSAVTAFNTADVVFNRGGGIGHLFTLPTGTYSVLNRLSSGLAVYKRQ